MNAFLKALWRGFRGFQRLCDMVSEAFIGSDTGKWQRIPFQRLCVMVSEAFRGSDTGKWQRIPLQRLCGMVSKAFRGFRGCVAWFQRLSEASEALWHGFTGFQRLSGRVSEAFRGSDTGKWQRIASTEALWHGFRGFQRLRQ